MRSMNCVLVTLLAPSLLACVTETDVSEQPTDEGEPVAEPAATPSEENLFCPPPPLPPGWNRAWVLTASNATDGENIDPSNGQCDSFVIDAHNVESMLVSVTSQTNTPAACVGTSLTTRRYLKNGSTWSSAGSVSESGVWTIDGCRLPSILWTAHHPDHARLHITTKRYYTSGQYSVLQYGLPFQARAWRYVPEVPN